MKKSILLSILLMSFVFLNAQKHMTRNGFISFFSSTPIEDIEAVNNQVASILDTETGELVFQVLMRSFLFEKKLMEEHFNENYVESDKYPKSTFKGNILNLDEVNFQKDGEYPVTVGGELTLHGVSREIKETGVLKIKEGIVTATSTFIIKPEDYNIEIPGVVRDKIAKEIEVKVDMKYEKM